MLIFKIGVLKLLWNSNLRFFHSQTYKVQICPLKICSPIVTSASWTCAKLVLLLTRYRHWSHVLSDLFQKIKNPQCSKTNPAKSESTCQIDLQKEKLLRSDSDILNIEKGNKHAASSTDRQYLYINVRRALPRIIVVQSHHPSSWHWMLAPTPPVPLCVRGMGERTQKHSNS